MIRLERTMAQPPRPSGFVREDAITDHFYRDSLPTNGFNQKAWT